ncbi:GNAT family N-acetyltransferase [Consotaella aegiceratis]|uniref:GNAT family N-acetyltransferase n=1 Tax=Consotaella aegiceratis TaxID=3097961 RepID=UPI002F3FC750
MPAPQPENDEGMRPPERFETRRLVIRKPVMEDAEAIYAEYATDPSVTRFLTWQPHRTLLDSQACIARWRDEWAAGRSFPFVIAEWATEKHPIGAIHLHPQGHMVGFGYLLGVRYHNRGYLTETLSALVEWVLAQPGIYRAFAVCDVENTASARVMEKAGLRLEGKLHRYIVHPNISSEPRDAYVYAKVK